MGFFQALRRFVMSWTGTIILVLLAIFFVAQAFIIPSRSMVGTLYEGDMLFVKKFSYGIPIPRLPWIDIPLFPDFKHNGHLIEGKRPQRGEVVVFIPPTNKGYYVKRLFATGGDEVIFKQDGFYLHPKESDTDPNYISKHFAKHKVQQFLGKDFVFAPYEDKHLGIFYSKHNQTYPIMLALASHQLQNQMGVGMELIDLDGENAFYSKIAPDHYFMIGDNRDDSSDSRFWGSVPYSHIVGTPWFIYFSLNLSNSIEAGEKPRDKFTVRWQRMFKSVQGLEAQMRERHHLPTQED
ncbi:Signal peptidase I [Helicobacter heilmannii]|uniref:signal peptidase I n=1 Tax=Helicobacter heilmannii TaxID=35817 RepID=UPI0006A108AE|nr:signal peptidase I [Helicobacter heilmannii]CRF47037.1 Signal peptidase I [Helicobacter heilmannii]